MKLYCKISPILMIIGFIVLLAGVIMSMSYSQTAAYILAGLGLIVYIVGRIGVYFTPKTAAKTENSGEAKPDTNKEENGQN